MLARHVARGRRASFWPSDGGFANWTSKLVVDCMYLKRVEFSTATGMLAMVTKVRQNGATIEFRNINYLIGALFALLGVDAVAQVQLRRV